jgi:hypothetical protein
MSSGMLRRVNLVRTDVKEERSASIIRVTRNDISSQRASVASYGYVPSSPILVTLMMEALSFSETAILTRAKRRKIPEDAILHVYLCSWYSFLLEAELVPNILSRPRPFLSQSFQSIIQQRPLTLG